MRIMTTFLLPWINPDSWGCDLSDDDAMDGLEECIVLRGVHMEVHAFATYRWDLGRNFWLPVRAQVQWTFQNMVLVRKWNAWGGRAGQRTTIGGRSAGGRSPGGRRWWMLQGPRWWSTLPTTAVGTPGGNFGDPCVITRAILSD